MLRYLRVRISCISSARCLLYRPRRLTWITPDRRFASPNGAQEGRPTASPHVMIVYHVHITQRAAICVFGVSNARLQKWLTRARQRIGALDSRDNKGRNNLYSATHRTDFGAVCAEKPPKSRFPQGDRGLTGNRPVDPAENFFDCVVRPPKEHV